MAARQRIIPVRREYNRWVANQTLEDYALRFTAKSARQFSSNRISHTAIGAISFLALEAIGGAITLSYGTTNAFYAILVAAVAMLAVGLPISRYAIRHGVDIDLLTRGASFGYIGSTITSLIYASFTFIFFALEAAIMAYALELAFDIPPAWGYLLCALLVIPLVTHGVTAISKLQAWSQPLWLCLLILPYLFVLLNEPQALAGLWQYPGLHGDGASFSPQLFGAALTVGIALVSQNAEQVDYLRFMPEKTPAPARRWWFAVVAGGPGWIVPGIL